MLFIRNYYIIIIDLLSVLPKIVTIYEVVLRKKLKNILNRQSITYYFWGKRSLIGHGLYYITIKFVKINKRNRIFKNNKEIFLSRF
jgi:hypothetical protein